MHNRARPSTTCPILGTDFLLSSCGQVVAVAGRRGLRQDNVHFRHTRLPMQDGKQVSSGARRPATPGPRALQRCAPAAPCPLTQA
eukprot:365632-Chlamydomonas_euryale.AAC.25